MAVTQRRLTLDKFLRLPEREPALEFEDGEVTQKVSPKARHSRVQSVMVGTVSSFAEPRQLAIAFTELRTTFGGRSYVPDVAVYRWERVPVDQTGQLVDDVEIPPDIAVEIVSPMQSITALTRRCRWYAAHGVPITLLIDPDHQSDLDFRPGKAPSTRRGTDRIDLDEVLPGFELIPRTLFDALRPKEPAGGST